MRVLNPALHDFLQRAFGQVKIANAGRPCRWNVPPARAMGHTRSLDYARVAGWGESYRVCCPMCRDTRFRLFFCHAGGCSVKKSGRSRPLHFSPYIAVCHNEGCHREPAFREWMKDNMRIPVRPLEELYAECNLKAVQTQFSDFITTEVDLPRPCLSLSDKRLPGIVHEFLQHRRFDPEELEHRYLCRVAGRGAEWAPPEDQPEISPMTFREDRLLIPILQRRRLVSWQARSFADSPSLKYLNPPGSHKEQWLYNMDQALLCKNIVIAEGVTDVWRIGKHAVALFGKNLSDAQMQLMKTLWGEDGQAIVVLDAPSEGSDTVKAARRIVERLNDERIFARGAWAMWLESGDPADQETGVLERMEAQAREELDQRWKRVQA